MKKNELAIIDTTTGEITRELKQGESIKIYNKIDSIKTINQGKTFLKLFTKFIKDIPFFKLTKAEYTTLFLLVDLLPYGSQIIQIDGVPANKGKLSKKLNINYQKLSRHLKKLDSVNVIKKNGTGKHSHFYINPFFICFGNKISDEAVELFYKSE